MTNLVKAFIENPRGSAVHHQYNEESFEFINTFDIFGEYPYPYGFIPKTKAEDGDCLDCYIITQRKLSRGMLYDCEIFGLMEVWEDNEEDHKILLYFEVENFSFEETEQRNLKSFEVNAIQQSQTKVGQIREKEFALKQIQKCLLY